MGTVTTWSPSNPQPINVWDWLVPPVGTVIGLYLVFRLAVACGTSEAAFHTYPTPTSGDKVVLLTSAWVPVGTRLPENRATRAAPTATSIPAAKPDAAVSGDFDPVFGPMGGHPSLAVDDTGARLPIYSIYPTAEAK